MRGRSFFYSFFMRKTYFIGFHLIEQMLLQGNGGVCRAKVWYGRLANEGQVFLPSFEQSGLLLISTGGV